MARRVLCLLVLLAAAAIGTAPAAQAAGETTHAWMVDRAVDALPAGPLKRLLEVQRLQALAGAAYPDTGYWVDGYRDSEPRPTDGFGEISHWQRFVDAYVAHIRERGCGDLADPLGPCAGLIAHVMGAAGHGLGDELWDWLFEPAMADHGEDPGRNFFSAGHPGAPLDGNPLDELSSSPEYAMDEVAIFRHGRWAIPQTPPPPVGDLLAVYERLGRSVTAEHILAGHAVGAAAMAAERAVAAEEGPRVEQDMPWSSSHFVTEPGGVDDVGRAISGYMQGIWRELGSDRPPAPRVVARYPAPGSREVPTRWLPARTSPGPSGGGARNRIVFALSHAVDPASVSPGTARLLDRTGSPVAQLDGFPRPGPYGAADGTHSVALYPAADLAPCARYTVELTRGIADTAGASLRHAVRWSFRTACR